MPKMNFKLRTKLLAGFSIPVICIFCIATLVYSSVHSLLKAEHWVDHTHNVIAEGKSILGSMVDMETGMRGYLIAGKEEFLAPYNTGQESIDKIINGIKKTVSDNPGQVKRLERIATMKDAWLTQAAMPQIRLREEVLKGETATKNFLDISSRIIGKEKFDSLREAIAAIDQKFIEQDDLQGRFILQAILMSMINQETDQRGFLLSGKEESLQPFTEGQQQFSINLEKLILHLQGNFNRQSVMDDLASVSTLADDWRALAAIPEINARRKVNEVSTTFSDITALIETGAGKLSMDTIRAELADFIAEESALKVIRTNEAEGIASMTIFLVLASAAIATLTVALFSFYIIRDVQHQVGGEPKYMADVTRRIAGGDLSFSMESIGNETGIYASMRDMTERLRNMLMKISDVAASQSKGADELLHITVETSKNIDIQHSATDQVAVAIEEMQNTASDVADNTAGAAESANQARELVDLGNTKAEGAALEIQQLSINLNNTSEIIQDLAESTNSINNILDVIKKIADQTNLLALNAAIEAARAGEQGRGFAVVADEVRSLAQNTQNSTAEIETMIIKVQNGAKASVESMMEGQQQATRIVEQTLDVKVALSDIKEAVHNITDMTVQIATAAEQQSATSNEVSRRVTEIKELSSDTESGAIRISKASTMLSELASQLNEEVSMFKI